MQKLGQHFLRNKSALRTIVKSLELTSGDTVIEIGPGHGELTEFLQIENRESRIILVEKDEKLSDLLKEKFGGDPRVTIFHGDALILLPTIIHDPKFKIGNYKIAGNIPYYITGHLLRIIGGLDFKPTRCMFTVQKEVAERICSLPPRMNRLAASVQFWANPKIIQTIPAEDFSPRPKVASAITLLETRQPIMDAEGYYAAVRALFSQPRKTIINNLKNGLGQKRDVTTEKLSSIGIAPTDRPQDLGAEDIAAIAKAFF